MNEAKTEREIREDDFVQVKYPMIKRLHELGIKNGNEIMLFCKIFYLQCDGKECIASNEYFAKLFCLSDRQIRDYLSDLKSKGLIKTYEKKLGMKTTTRYIYVQHDVLGTENIFQSYNKGVEEKRKTSGKNTSKEWKKSVKSAEDNFHHIKEDKRIDENNIYDGTKVPMVANAPASDEAKSIEMETNYNYSIINDTLPMDLNIYGNITEQDISDLQFNSKSHSDMYDDYEYVEKIYEKYIECCDYKKNASSTISSIKTFMKQYNCDEDVVEKCIGYFLYQNRKLKRSIEEIKIDFEQEDLAS